MSNDNDIKWLVEANSSLSIAGIAYGQFVDCNKTISFTIPRCDSLKFADRLDELIESANNELTYNSEIDFTIGNVTIHKQRGYSCSIIVNKAVVVYLGYIGRLTGLSKEIRKAHKKHTKEINELEKLTPRSK